MASDTLDSQLPKDEIPEPQLFTDIAALEQRTVFIDSIAQSNAALYLGSHNANDAFQSLESEQRLLAPDLFLTSRKRLARSSGVAVPKLCHMDMATQRPLTDRAKLYQTAYKVRDRLLLHAERKWALDTDGTVYSNVDALEVWPLGYKMRRPANNLHHEPLSRSVRNGRVADATNLLTVVIRYTCMRSLISGLEAVEKDEDVRILAISNGILDGFMDLQRHSASGRGQRDDSQLQVNLTIASVKYTGNLLAQIQLALYTKPTL